MHSCSASPGGGNGGNRNVGSGSYANGASGMTVGTGFAPGDPNYGTGNGANYNSGGRNTITINASVGSPGIGVFAVPVPVPATGGNNTRTGITGDNQISPGGSARELPESTEVPETPASAIPEVAASVPALGVLPTAPSEIAVKAAATDAGIPTSPLRASGAGRTPTRPAATQDQQGSETPAAAETAAPLRPDTATGQLRPRAKQNPASSSARWLRESTVPERQAVPARSYPAQRGRSVVRPPLRPATS